MQLYAALLQIPGMEQADQTIGEQLVFVWDEMGFMRWPLGLCLALGILVIIWKFFSLLATGAKTRRILKELVRYAGRQHPLRRPRAVRGGHRPRAQGHREPGAHRACSAR